MNLSSVNGDGLNRLRFLSSAASAIVLTSVASAVLHAEVRLPHIFSDHAVLQREEPIHVWGWSSPKENIKVAFHGQTRTVAANEYGEWSIWLAPESAGGPYTLTIQGDATSDTNPTAFSDLLVGDVWFASGQSNMEIPLRGFDKDTQIKNGDAEIANSTHPEIRLLRVEQKAAAAPMDDLTGSWTPCNPTTAIDFSAVAYFFGREINEKEHVPIGLIDSTWGGTPVEAWASMDSLSADASLMPAFASWAKFADRQTRLTQVEAKEKREDEAAEAAHQPKPHHDWHPFPASWEPAQLYNGMIAPATPYTIKGFIWYQGETNSDPERAPLYNKLFTTLIGDWRHQWREGNIPFLYVQISSYNSPGESWGLLRDQQRRALAVANTAMAVTLDVGLFDNVHPPDKQTVGARLALAAESIVYGHTTKDGKPIEYSGPAFRTATIENGAMRVYFDHATAALHAQGGALTGFEVAGRDGGFVPADAVIEGQTVVVKAAKVPDPVRVRYGWTGFTTANLYNAAGLPTSTFVSE
jgi:sialate O-acetylesterase